MSKDKVRKKQLTGTVVSKSGDKTVTIKIKQDKVHPLYEKRYQVDKKMAVHDEKNEYQVDDEVIVEECRPYSKKKRFKVVKKVE